MADLFIVLRPKSGHHINLHYEVGEEDASVAFEAMKRIPDEQASDALALWVLALRALEKIREIKPFEA